jgi:4-carboxymuconolactone decarboxylase
VLLFLLPIIRIAAQKSRLIENVLPADVYPESRNRLPLIKLEDLDKKSRERFDAAAASFAGAPGIGPRIRRYGNAVSNVQMQSPVGHALMQLAILITAREHDQPYEWSLHEMQAVAVGLTPDTINVVRFRKPLSKISDDKEASIIEMGREIFGAHRLGAKAYARALSLFGRSNLVDIIALMADYSGTSATLTAFNQQLPPGWKQFLPLPFPPPDDILSDSRNRLPLVETTAPGLPPALYSRLLSPAGTGPAQIRSHGAGLHSIEGSVGRRLIDLAILVTAREHDVQYDWTMNEPTALKDGLEPAIIDIVRNRAPVVRVPDKEASLIEFGRELFRKHNVRPETYALTRKAFGERNLVDLVEAMGQHSSEAVLLIAFDQHLPAGQEPLLPMAKSLP